MNNQQPIPKKQFLNGSRDRLKVFIAGLIILTVASGYVVYSQTELAKWKETTITGSVDTVDYCSSGRGNSGSYWMFSYEVDNEQYSHKECISSTGNSTGVKTISYNPTNPSQSILNTITVYQYIAVGAAVIGLFVVLGSLFASDTKKAK